MAILNPYALFGIDPTRGYEADRQFGASTFGTASAAQTSQMDSLRDYLAAIYGYDTQANIANMQGQYGLEDTRLRNAGQYDVANLTGNINRDIARFQDQGASFRTGLQESGQTGRSLIDNAGADFRTRLNAEAGLASSTYAPALASDRFGFVANNFAAPLLDAFFGITPGDPYQTRAMPTLSQGGEPDYLSLLSQAPQNAVPAPNYTPTPAPQRVSPAPTTGGAAPAPAGGGQARPMSSGAMRPPAGHAMGGQRPMVNAAPQAPARPPQAPAPARVSPVQTQAPNAAQPRVAQATQRQTPSVMQPLPTQVGGPQITTGPVVTNAQINSMVGRQQGRNAATEAGQNRTAERATAGAGFASTSPQLMAMKGQNSVARSFADQEAATTIPAQYAQMNAAQRLASEQAAANVFGQRRQEELARRGQESGFQTNLLSMIMGMAG